MFLIFQDEHFLNHIDLKIIRVYFILNVAAIYKGIKLLIRATRSEIVVTVHKGAPRVLGIRIVTSLGKRFLAN